MAFLQDSGRFAEFRDYFDAFWGNFSKISALLRNFVDSKGDFSNFLPFLWNSGVSKGNFSKIRAVLWNFCVL